MRSRHRESAWLCVLITIFVGADEAIAEPPSAHQEMRNAKVDAVAPPSGGIEIGNEASAMLSPRGGTTWLQPGLTRTPFTVVVSVGGGVREVTSICGGIFDERPSHRVEVTSRLTALSFVANSGSSSAELVLLVQTPTGSRVCAGPGVAPGNSTEIHVRDAEPGRYIIWVGTTASVMEVRWLVLRSTPRGTR